MPLQVVDHVIGLSVGMEPAFMMALELQLFMNLVAQSEGQLEVKNSDAGAAAFSAALPVPWAIALGGVL
jgi:hypothetical protein